MNEIIVFNLLTLNNKKPNHLWYTLRNRVAHGYFQVDFELIWKTIYQDLPDLYQQVRLLIQP